ncbi:MAG: hypothetical protein Q7J80_05885 [Anaerolineales bacterium]|nr:hypothetical protein [Anaerolineales bacterium]
MNTLERIVDEVKALPEFQAREVLDFVGYLKSRRAAPDALQTGNDDADWAEFEKLAGAWTGNFNRGECYDRTILR